MRPIIVTLAAWLAPAIAIAQETGDRATSFRAVTGSAHEDIPGGTLLVAAYAIVMVILALYVLYVAAMQTSTGKELDRLETLLQDKGLDDKKKD